MPMKLKVNYPQTNEQFYKILGNSKILQRFLFDNNLISKNFACENAKCLGNSDRTSVQTR